VNSGGVGAHGQLTQGSSGLRVLKQIQTLKEFFDVTFIALTLVPLGTRLLELSAQFLRPVLTERY